MMKDSTTAIAMEFCEGRSLEAVYKMILKRGGRTNERVLGKIACGVLGGLTYLHEKRIIHRGMCFVRDCADVDVKPGNILLTRQGEVKLCDFGISKQLVDSLCGTGEQTFVGTSLYMAVLLPVNNSNMSSPNGFRGTPTPFDLISGHWGFR
jgi:mitogen-activated protein kinase kinase